MREFLQAASSSSARPAPDGHRRGADGAVPTRSTRSGLRDYRVGLGDASLYPALLRGLRRRRTPRARARCCTSWRRSDFVGLEREVAALGLGAEAAELLVRVPQLRGGPEVLDERDGPVADAVGGLRACYDAARRRRVAERVIFDLGLARGLGYYTGAVFEVYDPALGEPLGGGGRYDDLLGRFGRAAAGGRLRARRRPAARRAGRRGAQERP